MPTPLVSIIIPCYKQAQWLPEAIDSALAQTYPNVEVVVVNDGSPDNTAEVCRRYAGRIVYVEQENKGLAEARNAAIRAAKGEFILPLDADDKLDSQALEMLVPAFFASNRIGFAYGRVTKFTRDHHEPSNAPSLEPHLEWNEPRMVIANLPTCTMLFRVSDWAAVGGYSSVFSKGFEDWDFTLNLMDRDKVGIAVDAPVFHYCQHAGGSMRTKIFADHFDEAYCQLIQRHSIFFARHSEYALIHWIKALWPKARSAEHWESLYWQARPGRLERYGIPIPLARWIRKLKNKVFCANP